MISRQRLRLQSRQHPSLPSRHPWLHGSVPLIISAILSAIAVLFLSTSPIMAGYPASQAPAVVIPASPSPLPPSAAAASTGDLIPPAAQPLVFRADLQPAFSIPVYTCQAGILARFAVQPGDRVAAGDTLAWLDDRLLRLEDQGAQATQSQAQLQYNRFRTAWERGMISAQELEQSAQALRLTELRRAQTSQALARTVLLAPVAGQVAEYQLYSGQPLPAAQECFRITDPIDLAAELSIPAVLLPRVRLGQTASARLEDTPSTQPLTGCVVRLSPVVDPASGGSLATVRFPSAGRFLRPGLAVHVRLQEE
jgi:RND family efflux transporter MFP subunit